MELRELKGTVRDDQGMPVSGASVTAIAPTGVETTLPNGTEADGTFEFNQLPLLADGDYTIKVEYAGVVIFIEPTDKVVFDVVAANKFVLTNGTEQKSLTASSVLGYQEILKVALTTAQLLNAQGNTDGQLHIDKFLDVNSFSQGSLPAGITNDALVVNWYIRIGNGTRVLPIYDDAELTRPKLWYQFAQSLVIQAVKDLQSYYYDLGTSGLANIANPPASEVVMRAILAP